MRVSLAVTGLVLLLAGCAAEPPEAAPTAGPPSSSAVSSAPVPASAAPVAKDLTKYLPSEAQLSAARVRSQRKRAPLVVGPGAPPRIVRACGADQPWDSAARNGAQAVSVTDQMEIGQLLAEYRGFSGEQVVSGLRAALNCGVAVVEERRLAVKSRFSLPGVTDPHLGFCGQFNARVAGCVLVLAHGDRVLALTAAGWLATAEEQQAELKRLAPTFTAAFDRD
ncbi:hypothetical protein G3I59_24040 [Amycolatopsis rubida]|uniref:Sensor domain-containing protein n=1 Tax=Amycolatopsis rubida TaxID=112413 RepID=A0ABX0C0K8_9PSEU|nr:MULTISPECIES: hypothetical protein [Amycolatopsis]MYW93599.1 hypothetical protein [Amycolatopsis rubida]NEC58586.1 hypothetical protein [Amycolatopsis rubida]OAP22675.1 hypothetical protein A4R44_06548 [Amycolatopsis sp. M39]